MPFFLKCFWENLEMCLVVILMRFMVLGYYLSILAQFHGSAHRKQRIIAYGSSEFCAFARHISQVSKCPGFFYKYNTTHGIWKWQQ